MVSGIMSRNHTAVHIGNTLVEDQSPCFFNMTGNVGERIGWHGGLMGKSRGQPTLCRTEDVHTKAASSFKEAVGHAILHDADQYKCRRERNRSKCICRHPMNGVPIAHCNHGDARGESAHDAPKVKWIN